MASAAEIKFLYILIEENSLISCILYEVYIVPGDGKHAKSILCRNTAVNTNCYLSGYRLRCSTIK